MIKMRLSGSEVPLSTMVYESIQVVSPGIKVNTVPTSVHQKYYYQLALWSRIEANVA